MKKATKRIVILISVFWTFWACNVTSSSYAGETDKVTRDALALEVKPTLLINAELGKVLPENSLVVALAATGGGPLPGLMYGVNSKLEARLFMGLSATGGSVDNYFLNPTLKYQLAQVGGFGFAVLGSALTNQASGSSPSSLLAAKLVGSYFFKGGLLTLVPGVTRDSSGQLTPGGALGLAFTLWPSKVLWMWESATNFTSTSVTTSLTGSLAIHFDNKDALGITFLKKNEDNSLSAGLLFLAFVHGIAF
ncbi:MAG: hypothetical protein ABIQ95_12230 [Bdellovibrionia bacterium]